VLWLQIDVSVPIAPIRILRWARLEGAHSYLECRCVLFKAGVVLSSRDKTSHSSPRSFIYLSLYQTVVGWKPVIPFTTVRKTDHERFVTDSSQLYQSPSVGWALLSRPKMGAHIRILWLCLLQHNLQIPDVVSASNCRLGGNSPRMTSTAAVYFTSTHFSCYENIILAEMCIGNKKT
jgi:hypothetical protein